MERRFMSACSEQWTAFFLSWNKSFCCINKYFIQNLEQNSLTYDVVSTVGTGVMLEEPGVDAFLMKSVSTRDNPQLLQKKIQQGITIRHCYLQSTVTVNTAV